MIAALLRSTSALLLAVVLGFAGTASAQFLPEECAGFLSLGFDFTNYNQYPVWFDDNSTMILAQAGVYQGPENIEEYVKFANIDSPYVVDSVDLNTTSSIVGFDPNSGTCTFLRFSVATYELDPTNTAGYSFITGYMLKFFYSIPKNKIDNINVYYTVDFLDFFFGTALDTQQSREYVCDVLGSTGCDDIYVLNGSPSPGACVGELESLPKGEGPLSRVDGNTQGCRSLHATFAQENSKHCAHISFTPAEDPNG